MRELVGSAVVNFASLETDFAEKLVVIVEARMQSIFECPDALVGGMQNTPWIAAGVCTASLQHGKYSIESVNKALVRFVVDIIDFVLILLQIIQFVVARAPHSVHVCEKISRKNVNTYVSKYTDTSYKLTVVFWRNDSQSLVCIVCALQKFVCREGAPTNKIGLVNHQNYFLSKRKTYSVEAPSPQNSTAKLSLETGLGLRARSLVNGITPPSTQLGTRSSRLAKAKSVGAIS